MCKQTEKWENHCLRFPFNKENWNNFTVKKKGFICCPLTSTAPTSLPFLLRHISLRGSIDQLFMLALLLS